MWTSLIGMRWNMVVARRFDQEASWRTGEEYAMANWNRDRDDRSRYGRRRGSYMEVDEDLRRPGPDPTDRGGAGPGYEDNWNDYGGGAARYGGSSSGGYGSGGSIMDYRDVVGGRDEYEHRYSDIRDVFPEESGHRGRGPRGYVRSDARISEDVNDRLTDDPLIDASDIDVIVERGEVTLSGTVMSRPAKRHAEDIAESVSGVRHVQNNLRIQGRAGVLMGAARTTGRAPDGSTGGGGNTPTVF
jgi:hypothetical protein